MSHSVAHSSSCRHREKAEPRLAMSKAHLVMPKHEHLDLVQLGRIVRRAKALADWTLDRFAREVERNPRQVSRWFTGKERAQIERIWAVEALREPLIEAFAEADQAAGGHVHATRTITIEPRAGAAA